jgi:hypothetical protein
MPLYVFALVEAPPARAGRGLSGAITVRKVDGGYAVVERRADVPPLDFGTLKKHEQVVDGLAASASALLPVRFGTLITDRELDAALEDRAEELREAFDLVRGRQQYTWRTSAPRSAGRTAPHAIRATSGVDYLRRAARAAHPAPPAAFRRARSLGRIAAAERYAPASPLIPGALYHLVDRSRADTYASAAADVRAHAPGLTWSGPFPAYAFAPELL